MGEKMNKLDNISPIPPNKLKSGIIYAPYVTKTVATKINNTTVWHSNKFINLWLKIKFFFWKPKDLKRFEKYSNKPINSKYYTEIKINSDE
jgi:hypothetical protein